MAKIMIVGSKQEIEGPVFRTLRTKHHNTLTVVESSENVLQFTVKDPPDIILMDTELPGGFDGIEVAGRIHEALSIPIIFMTGDADKETLERAAEMRPFGILVKPFEEHEVCAAVEIALFRAESEKRYRSLVENLNAVVYSVDQKGIITYVSPSVGMYGYITPSELVGRPFTDLIHPDDIPRMLNRFREVLAGKEMPIESRVVSKTGETHWMRFHGKATFEDGRLSGIRGVLSDVTEIRSAREELKKLNRELEARVKERTAKLLQINRQLQDEIEKRKAREKELLLLSHAVKYCGEGIALLDLEAKVLYTNLSFAETRGYAPGELVGKHFSIFHDPKSMPKADAAFRQVLEKGSFAGEIPQACRDGTVFPAMVHASLIRDESGAPIAVLGVVQDITERKKIEQYLFQNEKLASLGYLVSGIAHEINNPNSFITFNIPILREYLNELMPIIDDYAARNSDVEFFGIAYEDFRKDLFRILDNIQNGSDRITSTVSGLREFVREKAKTELRKVDLREIISRALAICKRKIHAMVKSFEVIIPEGRLEIRTDPEALQQVLINLLINAVQASDKEESMVKLHVIPPKKPEEPLIIKVTDNGCGIDEQSLGRIFDPFFTTKPVGEGTGLGLSVCHRLMEQMGGRLEAESEVEKGSTFAVILPGANAERVE